MNTAHGEVIGQTAINIQVLQTILASAFSAEELIYISSYSPRFSLLDTLTWSRLAMQGSSPGEGWLCKDLHRVLEQAMLCTLSIQNIFRKRGNK
jgi:hypothetical protein